MKKKIDLFNIDNNMSINLKGIAIFFILFGHLNYIYRAGAWGVNLFLILSGYGINCSYLKNNNKDYFTKKIKKIYLPYLLVITIILLYNIYIYIYNFIFSKKVILISLLGMDFDFNIDKTMWYISFIFVEYLVFYISCFVANIFFRNQQKKNNLILFLNLLFGIILFTTEKNIHLWNAGAGTFLYCFAFPLGILISKSSTLKTIQKKRDFIFKIVLWILFIMLICLYKNINTDIEYILYSITMPIIIIISNELKVLNNKYIKYLGTYSFDIYLWEGFILKQRNFWFSELQLQILIDITTLAIILFISYYYRHIIINPIINNITKFKNRKKEKTQIQSLYL